MKFNEFDADSITMSKLNYRCRWIAAQSSMPLDASMRTEGVIIKHAQNLHRGIRGKSSAVIFSYVMPKIKPK